jgi:hypothetical protein
MCTINQTLFPTAFVKQANDSITKNFNKIYLSLTNGRPIFNNDIKNRKRAHKQHTTFPRFNIKMKARQALSG